MIKQEYIYFDPQNPEFCKKMVEKYFGEIKKGPEIKNPEPWHVTLEATKKVFHEDNFARSPRLSMSFPTVNQLDDDAPALELSLIHI